MDTPGSSHPTRVRSLTTLDIDACSVDERTSGTSWHLTLRILVFALVAAMSPFVLASALVVLTGERARLKGVALAAGVIAGQALLILFVVAVGLASTPDHKNHSTVVDVGTIAFGAALLLTALYLGRRRHEPEPPHEPSPRAEAVHSRLANVSPVTAFGTGTALGIGGPRRITVTLVVCAAIAAAGVGGAGAVGLSVLYVAVATILVWVPVVLYIGLGERATEWLENGQRWIGEHKQSITVYGALVLGSVLVVDGIVHLAQ